MTDNLSNGSATIELRSMTANARESWNGGQARFANDFPTRRRCKAPFAESIKRRFVGRNAILSQPIVVLLLTLAAASPVAAQTFGRADGTEIGLLLWTNDARQLSESLNREIETTLRNSFVHSLGPQAHLDTVASVDGDAWLANHDIEELTPALCTEFGLDRRDADAVRRWQKTMVVKLEWQRGKYHVTVAEYDDTFYQVGRVHHAEVIQREIVPLAISRLAMQCWTAIGTITATNDNFAEVSFTARSASPWIRIPQDGEVLQLCQQLRLRDGVRIATSKDQYLRMENATTPNSKIAIARLMKPAQTPNWLARFGQANIRFLARRLDSQHEALTVEVRLQEKAQPREGCEVYISPSPPASLADPGKRIGLTDTNGQLTFTHTDDPMFFVSVRYNDLVDTRIYAHGAGSGVLTFMMPDRQKHLEFNLEMKRLRDELQNRRHRIQHLASEMKKAGDSADVSAARQTLTQAQKSTLR